jgi:large subunit ribosomal protein L25
MQKRSLNAQLRSEKGKNECNRLRMDGYIPSIIYSHGTAEAIKIKKNDFTTLFKGHISESVIFTLHIEGKGKDDDQMAFIKDYQRNPRTGEISHLDLFKVTKDEKIHTVVPLEFTGTPKGTKIGGLVEISKHDIEVECLPADLPEKIVIDISDLDINDYIHAKTIKIQDSVTIMTNPETVIVGVYVPKVVVEEAAPVEGVEGVAAEGEGEGEGEGETKGESKGESKAKGKASETSEK